MADAKGDAKKKANGKVNGAANTAADGSGSGAVAESAPTGNKKQPEITPEMRAKLDALRGRIQTSVGQAVLSMMNLPRYKNQTLGDLEYLVLEPLMHDRLAIATAKADDKSGVSSGLVGIAIWASADDEVDTKIREQIKSGVFPTRLQSEDWASGDTLWLLDILALNKQAATSVLASFAQIAKDKPVNIHPIVSRSVDAKLLEQLKRSDVSDGAAS